MPKNAEVLLDHEKRLYHSPVHIALSGPYPGWEKLEDSIASVAYQKDYSPDPVCRDAGDFFEDGGPVFWSWLEKLGVLQRSRRWNPDGSWNEWNRQVTDYRNRQFR